MKCINCNKAFDEQNGSYCPFCGKQNKNICKNTKCVNNKEQVQLPSDAMYCQKCGHATTFNNIPKVIL